VLNQVLRDEFGSVPMLDVLTEKRAALMTDVTERLKPLGKQYGIDIVDVRFKRVDLPVENSEAIYNRMKTQRAQEAANFRAQGQREAREKRAEADKQVVVTLAEARRQAEILRGQGDAEATRIYNDAFGQDPKFFDFYRSLKAMQTGLGGNNTTFVGQPKGDFFRFFEQDQGDSGQFKSQPQQ
jgi:membrane protease subunit HflC